LCAASKNGHFVTVKALLEKNADPQKICEKKPLKLLAGG